MGFEPATPALRKRCSSQLSYIGKTAGIIARMLLFTPVTAMILSVLTRARSEVGLSRLPVTEKIAGSNPVGPAMKRESLWWLFFHAVSNWDWEPSWCVASGSSYVSEANGEATRRSQGKRYPVGPANFRILFACNELRGYVEFRKVDICWRCQHGVIHLPAFATHAEFLTWISTASRIRHATA